MQFKSNSNLGPNPIVRLAVSPSGDNPTPLPSGYSWRRVECGDAVMMSSIAQFITDNYGRGESTNPRFYVDYSSERIVWQLGQSGWMIVLLGPDQRMCGVIGIARRRMQLREHVTDIAEPMFMCCIPTIRGKGITRVLSDEAIRQCVDAGLQCGLFCNQRIVVRPLATIRCYSRVLSYRKLKRIGFIELTDVDDDAVTESTKIRLKPSKHYTKAVVSKRNVAIIKKLYDQYMESFALHRPLSGEEIESLFLDDRFVVCLIAHDDAGNPIDFIAYTVYTILDRDNMDNKIRAADIIMYSSNKISVNLLVTNALKQLAHDSVNVVYLNDMMHSSDALLTSTHTADHDTDAEEAMQTYDMNFVKTKKKTFINLYNWNAESMRQDTVSWTIV